MQDLLGKVALISGGTTGIGLAAAKAFVVRGAKVVVAARNPERGIQAEQELRHLGGDAAFHRCDVSDPSAVADLRSEEHTSELQSQSNLVCRLLLEKKKKTQTSNTATDKTSSHRNR